MSATTLTKTIEIMAPKEAVWKVLLEDETYRRWCAVFMEGSYAETDWSEGSLAHFKGPDGRGMASRILKHEPNELIEMEHVAVLDGDRELHEGKEAEQWIGLGETYQVSGGVGSSTLVIKSGVPSESADWFDGKWDEALSRIKEMAEKRNLERPSD